MGWNAVLLSWRAMVKEFNADRQNRNGTHMGEGTENTTPTDPWPPLDITYKPFSTVADMGMVKSGYWGMW
jgi:hypothetical protein